MIDRGPWDATRPSAWASALGLVFVPLFPGQAGEDPREGVLLDGSASSFHMVSTDSSESLLSDAHLGQSWSSNLVHSLGIDLASRQMVLRRWDVPGAFRKFQLPESPTGAESVLHLMTEGGLPATGDVVIHMLRAFRAIRSLNTTDEPLIALRRFNTLLAAAEAVEQHGLQRERLLGVSSFDEVRLLIHASAVNEDMQATLDGDLGVGTEGQQVMRSVLQYFLSPEPHYRYVLVPSLLLRHAIGQLYQETHLVIDTEHRQLAMPGFAPELPGGTTRRDVRFTPANLARALVDESLASLNRGVLPNRLDVLDPACGSGVFLIETIRALAAARYTGALSLRGFDVSALSVDMARFALAHAMRDARLEGLTVDARIERRDALRSDWGSPDVVVMNPPFIPWGAMSPENQIVMRETLGPAAHGRIDMAMAFVTLASRAVAPGGTVASVLPAALLETQAGEAWREQLAGVGRLSLLGRFEGFGYFRASVVEPAFIVISRRVAEHEVAHPVEVLVAREGHEDEALRALRRSRDARDHPETSPASWDLYEASPSSVEPTTWLPRRRSDALLLEMLAAEGLPKVGQLFDVRQGARTGSNEVFLMDREALLRLPRGERRFFRPVAGNATIRDGHISEEEYVFFPYGPAGPLLELEEDVAQMVPRYYEARLLPAKDSLTARPGIQPGMWWSLTRPRLWQYEHRRKLVTTYFGDRSSFAFDQRGDFVVVQGHAWFWQSGLVSIPGEESGEVVDIEFEDSVLPWAYLSLVTSVLFERIVAAVSPRVQGGQFNLSPRFIAKAFIPNLADDMSVLGEVVLGLANAGRRLASGTSEGSDVDAEDLVRRAYRVPIDTP